MNTKYFTNKDLALLFIPLIFEQFLEYLTGLFDSIMVAHVGEAAVSGVSLIEFIIQLILSFFIALATGGAVVAGQYIGKKEMPKANKTVNQLVWFIGIIGIVTMISTLVFKNFIFKFIFGKISEEVYFYAEIYFYIVIFSIPFLALYNAGAAIFRTIGDSKTPMKIMVYSNLLNILGNWLLIYHLELGTAGAAIPTLISRILSATIILYLLTKENQSLILNKTLKYRIDKNLINKILKIGIPYGLENGMFYLGRLLIISLVTSFGTAAIAANSISQTIIVFQVLPGTAIGLGLTTIIARYSGMKDIKMIRYYTKKIISLIYILFIFLSLVILILLPKILELYNVSSQANIWTYQIVWSYAFMLIFWPLGYTLPVVFRASGNARFPMVISMLSMIFCRIISAYILAIYFNLGMIGTWIAMYLDWIVKGIIFTWRYLGNKWLITTDSSH